MCLLERGTSVTSRINCTHIVRSRHAYGIMAPVSCYSPWTFLLNSTAREIVEPGSVTAHKDATQIIG